MLLAARLSKCWGEQGVLRARVNILEFSYPVDMRTQQQRQYCPAFSYIDCDVSIKTSNGPNDSLPNVKSPARGRAYGRVSYSFGIHPARQTRVPPTQIIISQSCNAAQTTYRMYTRLNPLNSKCCFLCFSLKYTFLWRVSTVPGPYIIYPFIQLLK